MAKGKNKKEFLCLVEIPNIGNSVILQIKENGKVKTIRTSGVVSYDITDNECIIETKHTLYHCTTANKQDFYSRVLLSFAKIPFNI